MSYGFLPDDVPVPVVSYGPTEKTGVVANGNLVAFQEEAVSAQRLAVTRLLKKHVKGSMIRATPEYGKKIVNEKMFRLNKLIEWNDGPPDVVVEALAAGRLRCRLNAAMGLGKSTLLASYVAKAMNYRVLHVSLDAQAMQQVAVYIHDSAIGTVSRNWTDKRKAHLCFMTYSDFNGHMMSSRRSELFKCFDLLIFDEGFVKNDADVFVAGKFFSEYSLPDTNLIMCSGTLRTDVSEDDMGSKGVGSFKQLSVPLTVDKAIQTGKLVTDYLVDRSLVIAPSNQDVYDLVNHYECNGVDVKYLDDASDYEALRDGVSWLSGDSTVPRVFVVYWEYYIAFNFPISYVILWPYYEVWNCIDGIAKRVQKPMSEAMVIQAKSRSGRGIVDGSGGVVMSPERSVDDELIEEEKMKAFVKLCAGAIKPLRTSFWKSCYDVFPEGLPVATAMTVLKICLPVEIAIKYMGADGLVASRYCAALNAFAQPDHFLMASDEKLPVGYDKWGVYEHVVDEQIEAVEDFKLPYDCDGEMRIALVAIELLAQHRIIVNRWRPKRPLSLNDGYDSDDERRDPRFAPSAIRLRRIEDRELPPLPIAAPIREIPWEFRPIEGIPAQNRSGGYINSTRCRDALLELEACLLAYKVPVREVVEVVEEPEGTVTPIVADGYGDVESPGGSVVCTLPVKICEKMNLGQELNSTEFLKMATAARIDVDRFVASKLFDAFSGPWQSLLNSLLAEPVAREVVRRGVASDVYAIVDKMRLRFNVELCSVLAGSNIFKTKFLRVFRVAPSADQVMQEVRAGKFDRVAQTDGFIDRVKFLKTLIDEVLLYAERNNVYLPTYITGAQRALPIRGQSRLGYVGDNVQPMPKHMQKVLQDSGGSKGGGSFDSKRSGW